jgi:hypothetical protein
MLMTEHTTAIKVPTFPEEFKPLIKVLNRACCNDDIMQHVTDDEAELISGWLDEFKSLALEFSV